MWGSAEHRGKSTGDATTVCCPKNYFFKISLSLSLFLSLLCLCMMCVHVHVYQYQCTCQTACVEVRDNLRSKSSLSTWSQCPVKAFTATYTRLANLWASQDSPIPTSTSVGTIGLQVWVLCPALLRGSRHPNSDPHTCFTHWATPQPPRGTLYFIVARPRASSMLLPWSDTLSLTAPFLMQQTNKHDPTAIHTQDLIPKKFQNGQQDG